MYRKVLAFFLSILLVVPYSELQLFASSEHSPIVGTPFLLDSGIKDISGRLRPMAQVEGPFILDPKSPLMILIRDLHCHAESQTNIARILKVISSQRAGQNLPVFVEGADGPVDTHLVSDFPVEDVRLEVARNYLEDGKITGPEFLSLTQSEHGAVSIWGVESADLYFQDLIKFRAVIAHREETLDFFRSLDDVLKRIEEKMFSKDLLRLVSAQSDFQKGQMTFDQFVLFLADTLPPADEIAKYSQVSLMVNILKKQESIRDDEVNHEKDEVLKKLGEKLSRQEIQELIRRSLELRLTRISPLEYFIPLEELIQKNLNPSDYPNLFSYIELVKMQSNIQHEFLFREVEALGSRIKAGLAQTKSEKDLLNLELQLRRLGRLYLLEMTREDIQACRDNQDVCRIDKVIEKIEDLRSQYLPDEEAVLISEDLLKRSSDAEAFYRLALEREEKMARGTLQDIRSKNLQTAVLITGGFHTDGMIQRIKNSRLNYMVVTPKVSTEPDMHHYFDLMMNEKIAVTTLSFFSIFSQRMASELRRLSSPTNKTSLRFIILRRFLFDLVELSLSKKVDASILLNWVRDEKARENLDQDEQKLLEEVKARISDFSGKRSDTFGISDENIRDLVMGYSLLTAKLTVELLRELHHPSLSDAEKFLQERNAKEASASLVKETLARVLAYADSDPIGALLEFNPVHDDLWEKVSSVYREADHTVPESFRARDFNLANAVSVFSVLDIQPGEALLEIGPGFTTLSLAAALLGAHVTIVETPEMARVSGIQERIEKWLSTVQKAGGNIRLILGDINDPNIRGQVGEESFDHIWALDVLRPDSEKGEAAFRQSSAGSAHARYHGIFEESQVENAVQWLISLKKAGTGSIYVSHPDSYEVFHPIPQIDSALGKKGLVPVVKSQMMMPRMGFRKVDIKNRMAQLYQFDRRSLDQIPQLKRIVQGELARREALETIRLATYGLTRDVLSSMVLKLDGFLEVWGFVTLRIKRV